MAQAQTVMPRAARETVWQRLWHALDERLALHALAYPVPEYANTIPYLLGGTTLIGFIILFITGVLLAQFYHATPTEAHQSVEYVITQVPFGDFLRSIHFWMANLVTVTAFLHLIRVFSTASFKRPREVNWLVGVGLLGMTLAFVFTGTVLKWDQEGFEALNHNKEIAELLGVFGVWFSSDFTRSTPLLDRLFIGHATILPFLFLAFIAAHIFLIKELGISPRPAENATSGVVGYPVGQPLSRFTLHLKRMVGLGLLLFVIAELASIFFPAPLGFAPVPGEEVTKPPWMLIWLYPVENLLGVQGILIGGAVFFALLALVPLIDRSPWLAPRRRRAILIAGGIVLLIMIALLVMGYVTVPVTHVAE